MNRQSKAALFSAGALVSAAVVGDGLFRMVNRGLVCEALDRAEPKWLTRLLPKLRGYDDLEELQTLLEQGRQRLVSQSHETVELISFDGTRLFGHLYRHPNAKRAVVAMHGWRSGWARDFGMIAPFLAENNCTVLYAEQRGQGESDGAYMGFGMVERHDCTAWANWMAGNGFGELPLYLAGISMGAATVLMAAGSDSLPENLCGIVADCGFISAAEEWRHITEKNLHMTYTHRQKHVDSLCRRRIALNSDGYSTLEAMKTNKTPILFIHGSADTFVPPEMTLRNFEACTAPKKLLLVEGANHAVSYLKDKEAYEQAVREFWEEHDKTGFVP